MRVLFQSTFALINAQKICKVEGVSVRVVPVPREISSDCGMSLLIAASDRERLEKAFQKAEIEHQFYELSA
jgi:hypothetical protein